jgi:hypothetical protein
MQALPPLADFDVAHSGIDAARGLGGDLIRLLQMTRALASVGRSVDLTGLDRQVGLLCAKALDLMPEDGRTLRPMLIGLLADLDALSATLAVRKDVPAD